MRAFVFYTEHFKWHYLLVIADHIDKAWEAVGKKTKWPIDSLKSVCKILVDSEIPAQDKTVVSEL